MSTALAADVQPGPPLLSAVALNHHHLGYVGVLEPLDTPQGLLRVQQRTREMIGELLKEGTDYGRVPGTAKDTLFKPGAEKINMAFGCVGVPVLIEKEIDHFVEVPWTKRKKSYSDGQSGRDSHVEETHGKSHGLYRYVFRVDVVHRASGQVVGSCIGVCSTLESKYVDRPRDSENTVAKMAQKRAYVGAVLNAFGLSEWFTQDVEEFDAAEDDGESGGQRRRASRRTTAPPAANGAAAPVCPICSGAMWDNRGKNDQFLRENPKEKRPKRPDWKCQKKGCNGCFFRGQWKEGQQKESDEQPPLAVELRALAGHVRELDPDAGAKPVEYVEDLLREGDSEKLQHAVGLLRQRVERLRESAPAGEGAGSAEDRFGRMFADAFAD